MNLECEYIQSLIHEYFDGELSDDLSLRVKKHLEHCEECHEVYKQITMLSSLIKFAFARNEEKSAQQI